MEMQSILREIINSFCFKMNSLITHARHKDESKYISVWILYFTYFFILKLELAKK